MIDNIQSKGGIMKLLVKSDDYGFTKGITLGILDAIENGIITCTGLFVNMPVSKWAADEIAKLPQACLGIDLNIASGPCVADKKLLPNLVDQDTGLFIRSTVKYDNPLFKTDKQADLWPYEECLIELRAQINKFKELTGKDPEYLNGHSVSSCATHFTRAIHDLSVELGIPYSKDVFAKYGFKPTNGSWNHKPFLVEEQLATSSLEFMKKHVKDFDGAEYALIGGHGGFVDAEIFKWSTYTIIRAKDHEMYTSEFMKNWIKENNVQLISFRDLKG